jgi:hypothetical protein
MRKVWSVALLAAVALAGNPVLSVAAVKNTRRLAPQVSSVTIAVNNAAGQPLQGAQVNVYQTVDGKETLVYSGVTDASGNLAGNLPAGSFRIEALSGGKVVGTSTLTVADGTPATATIATTVGVTAGGSGAGLFGLGPVATIAVLAAAGTLVYVGVEAAQDDASPSR